MPIEIDVRPSKIEFLSIPPSEIARQLTLIEFDLFLPIDPLDIVSKSTR